MSAPLDLFLAIISRYRIGLPFQRRLREQRELSRIQITRIENLLMAQTRRDEGEIASGKKNFGDFPLTLDGLPALSAISERSHIARMEPTIDGISALRDVALESALDHLRRARNVDAALSKTHALLSNDQSPLPATDVEADWLYSWRAAAADVSSEDIQALLARMLAGEIKQPGAFSFHAINFLRTACPSDIDTIKHLCPYIFNRRHFWISTASIDPTPVNDRIVFESPPPAAISMQMYTELVALGLLSTVGDPAVAWYWQKEPSPQLDVVYFHRKLRVSNAPGCDAPRLHPPFQSLTRLGEELVELVSREVAPLPVEGYIEKMIDEINAYKHYFLEELPNDAATGVPRDALPPAFTAPAGA